MNSRDLKNIDHSYQIQDRTERNEAVQVDFKIKLAAFGILSLVALQVTAQQKTGALFDRAKQVAENITEKPMDLAEVLSDDFRSKVSEQQLKSTLSDTFKTVGKCALYAQSEFKSGSAGGFLLKCEKGILPIDLSVDETDKSKITGLFIRKPYQLL